MYALREVNGATPPVVVIDDPATSTRVQVTAGQMEMGTDGRYTARIDFLLIQGETQAPNFILVSGGYTRTGSDLAFTSDNPAVSSFTGTIGDNDNRIVLSYSLAGKPTKDQLVFVKQT